MLNKIFFLNLLFSLLTAQIGSASSRKCESLLARQEESDFSSSSLRQRRQLQEAAWIFLEQGHVENFVSLEQELQSRLENNPIEGPLVMATSGSSEVFFVEFADHVKAVFKPSARHWRHRRIRPFHEVDAPHRDVAAWKLDRLLGMNMVPVTLLRTIDGVEGSLQTFVRFDNEPLIHGKFRNLVRLKIFDYIAGVWDRSPANRPSFLGGPVAIDNSMAFLTKFPHRSFGITPPPHVETIAKLLESYPEEFLSLTLPTDAEVRLELSSHLPTADLEACIQRLGVLRQMISAVKP